VINVCTVFGTFLRSRFTVQCRGFDAPTLYSCEPWGMFWVFTKVHSYPHTEECSPGELWRVVELQSIHQSLFALQFWGTGTKCNYEPWGGIQSICATCKTGKVVVGHKNPLMFFSFFLRHPKPVVIEHDLTQTWWEQKKNILGSKGFSWWKAIVRAEEPWFPLEEAIAHQSSSW
jgi:hypothetical protein